MPYASGHPRPRRVAVTREGPVLLEGPVEVVDEEGNTYTSDRFVVALCTCRRSRSYPWCDTSHRRRAPDRHGSGPAGGHDEGSGRDDVP